MDHQQFLQGRLTAVRSVAQDAHTVSVRDNKNVVSPWLVFTHAEWQVFLDGVRNGDFDLRPVKATASA